MSHTATVFILVFCLAFILPGCKEKPKNPVEEYGNSLIDSYHRSQNTADAANINALNQAVKDYHAMHGEYPKRLGDLESLCGFKIDSDKYDYDQGSGIVSERAKK